jgi:hypothetical protein
MDPSQAPTYTPAPNPENCEVLPKHVDYTINRLANSHTIKAPYEHIVIHDVFHPELYACMLAHLPKPGANYGGTISKGLRTYFKVMDRAMGGYAVPKAFTRSQAKFLLPTFDTFWRQFSGAFSGTEFRNKWLDLFKSTLQIRFPQLQQDTHANRFYYRMDMARDGLNYFINPHTDSVAKVIKLKIKLKMIDTSAYFGFPRLVLNLKPHSPPRLGSSLLYASMFFGTQSERHVSLGLPLPFFRLPEH